MSEAKWTAGPWGCNLPENGYIAIESMGNRIARVDVEADDPKVVESLTANANLIAASPDLYAALEEIVRVWAIKGRYLDKAETALAKARGEELPR